MQRGDLTFQQIYNNLLAGNKLVLHFPDATSAETFRTRMHHHKAQQEENLKKLGLWNDEEKTVLSFRTKADDKEGSKEVVAYVAFQLPSPLKKYKVLILEEEDLKGGSQVSGAVG